MKKITVLILTMFAVLAAAHAQNNAISTAVPLLNEATDARSSGMGSTGTATSPDLASQHWNAAKYVFMDSDFGASLTYTPWLRSITNDANQAYLSGFYKLNNNRTISASLWYNSLGNINRTDEQGTSLGEIKSNEFAFDLAYAQHLAPNWSASVLFRYINSNLMGSTQDTKPGQAVAADLGVYHQKDVLAWGKKMQYAFGLNFSNIGTKVSYSDGGQSYFLPMNMRLGGRVGMDLSDDHNLAFALDLGKLMVPTPDSIGGYSDKSIASAVFSSFSDAPDGFSEELKEVGLSLGLEYTYKHLAVVRTGYFTENQYKGARRYFTLGAGLLYKDFSFDVSYLISTSNLNDALDNTFRFTLGFQMGKAKSGSKRTNSAIE